MLHLEHPRTGNSLPDNQTIESLLHFNYLDECRLNLFVELVLAIGAECLEFARYVHLVRWDQAYSVDPADP